MRTMLHIKNKGILEISPTKIFLDLDVRESDTAVPSVDVDEKLDEYYSDFSNFYQEDKNSIESMLSSFWQRYIKHQEAVRFDLQASEQLFDLCPPYTLADIKARFKALAQKMHPDRGGDAKAFIDLQNAYACLKAYLKGAN
jgi:hypothetical protein